MCLPATILIFGHDPMLLTTRRWLLERAGFEVFTVAEPNKAAEIAATHRVDLLVLCHTLTTAERRAVSEAQPHIKQLVLLANAQEIGREEVEGETLHLFAGAAALITAARNLLD